MDQLDEKVLTFRLGSKFDRVLAMVKVRDTYVIVTESYTYLADLDYSGELRIRMMYPIP